MGTVSRDPLFGDNHLTAIRLFLALTVAVCHSWSLTLDWNPLRFHDWKWHWLAVNGFFVLSGLLIAKSLHLRADIRSYFMSRFLRIYPALIAVMIAFVFIFAPVFGAGQGFAGIFNPESWAYAGRVLVLGDPQHATGAIFPDGRSPEFNSPLWTIRFEMLAYISAAVAFMLGAVKSLKRTLTLFLIVQLAYLGLPFLVDVQSIRPGIMPMLRLASAFLMGMTLWHWPAARRPAWWIVAGLVLAFILFGGTIMGELIANLALAGVMLRLGLPKKSFRPVVKMPDYSYGIYIWHFPVLQVLLFAMPALTPWQLTLISFPLYMAAAMLSWHWIEKPALGLKKKIPAWLSGTPKPGLVR